MSELGSYEEGTATRGDHSDGLDSMMRSELRSTREQLRMDQKRTEILQTSSKTLESPDESAEWAQMGQKAWEQQCMILSVDSSAWKARSQVNTLQHYKTRQIS